MTFQLFFNLGSQKKILKQCYSKEKEISNDKSADTHEILDETNNASVEPQLPPEVN